MHHYEFFCRACNRPFSKSPTPFECQRRQSGLSKRCGSEEVDRDGRGHARSNGEARPTEPFENINSACHSLRAACRVKVPYACKEITGIPR